MRAFAIGCAAVLLLTSTVGCKKKPAEKKADPAGEMASGDMKPAGDVKPGERPVAQPEKQPVAEVEPKLPVDKDAVPEGVLSGVKGAVEVRRSGTSEFKAAADDTKVFAKDSVRVGKDGEATLALWDNSSVELTPESAITLNTSAAIKNPSPSVTVMAGAARFDVNKRTEGQGVFSIYTPSAAVAVQGTVLAVGVGLLGNARVAVEEGNVAVTAVAKVDAKPVMLPAGRVVIVPMGKVTAAPSAYSAEKAGWDEWLESEGQAAVKKAAEIAKLHSGAVDQLNTDADTLESAEDKESLASEALEKQVTAAATANKPAEYKKLQPRLAVHLNTQAAVRNQLRFTNGRRYAHAYLLGLLAGRIEGGVYKTKAEVRAAVLKDYQRVSTRRAKWRLRRYKRRIRQRKRVRRHRRAYYLHSAEGRILAPKLKVEVPKFYAKVRLRRKLRRQRIAIAGWKGPVYHRPRYRGKRRKLEAGSLRRRNNKTWYANKKWRERRAKRWNRNKAKRVLWKKHAQKRRVRWAKRPSYRKKMRQMRRKWRRGMRRGMGPRGMRGVDPRGMHGMGIRGMRGMGPHGMRGVDPRGIRGMRGMGPHGMRLRGMRFGMRLRGMRLRGMRMRGHMGVRGMRIRRPLRRRGMGMGM
jgi:hypothetical protein